MEFFRVQKGGPSKIGGPVRPNSSNMPKAGPAPVLCVVGWSVKFRWRFDCKTTLACIPVPEDIYYHIILLK